MLMEAIPTGVREELVATKSLSPVKVIAKLMTIYQPGGLHERTVILRQLEDPGEASNALTGVQSLRKWSWWLRRAQDVGLCLPNSTILLRGLTKLMKKLLSQNPEFAFRTSLVRNTLQLDTSPKHQTVRTYSEHLLSELEQLVHLEKSAERATTAGYPWGLPDAPPEEQIKLVQDDALMLRMLTLYIVAQIARDARLKERTKKCLKAKVGFLLEQPAAPEWCPECVSWWRNRTWLLFKYYYQMEEVTFFQGDFGGEARKPTTCGTNLGKPPDPLAHGGRSREQGPDMDSWDDA